MHIELTDEQTMLRDSAARYLRDNYGFDRRQAAVKAGDGFDRAQWQTFAELGWLAMPFSEDHGGFDGGALETLLLCEQFGRHLVIEPWLETVVLAGGLIQRGGNAQLQQRYLPGIAAGTVQGAFAHQGLATATRSEAGFLISGKKSVVFNAPAADVILVSALTGDGSSLFAVDAASQGVRRRDYPTYDGRHASELELDHVSVPESALVGELHNAAALIEEVIDQALLAVCAEAVGAMDALIQATVEYTSQRRQFGQPIARFQVLRHRMADMFIHCELTRSLLLAVAFKLDQKEADAPRLVAALKARVGKAGKFIGQNAIQLHGGIGMTEELAIGHYFKRLAIIEQLFGARDVHLQRFSDLSAALDVTPQQST